MSINACIFDNNHKLIGCITKSVLSQFKNEFEGICNEFEANAKPAVLHVLGIMKKTLVLSCDKCSAEFLNCLKLMVHEPRYDVPIDFLQSVSRAYHNLIRLCTSSIVYDEVLNETIDEFRKQGMFYEGYVVDSSMGDLYAFEYEGFPVNIRMVEKSDLYRFWQKDCEEKNAAIIVVKGKNILITHSGNAVQLSDAIKACAQDFIDEEESSDLTFGDLATALIDVAKMLAKNGKND